MNEEEIDKKILGEEPKWFDWKKKLIVVLIVFACIFGYFKYGTIRTVDVTIGNTDSKDGIFLVFTDDGTYKNVDSWFHFKFKSSDVQGMAAPGAKVTLKVYGFRSGITSSYPNVISISKQE